MVVPLKPSNRRRVVVKTDVVTGAMNNFSDVDNFSLGNLVKGIGNIASATKLPIISTVGQATAGLVQNSQDKKTASSPAGKSLADYEGKYIRVGFPANKNAPIYFVSGGEAKYLDKLPSPRPSIIEVPVLPGTAVKKIEVTPMISPLPMSVPSTPGDANIKAAVQATGQSMAEKIVQQVEKIPVAEKQAILQKAQGIFDSGSNGVLSKAQKQLQNLSTSILPKTKAVKDAEKLLTAPQHKGNQPLPNNGNEPGSSLSFSNPWVIGGIVAVIIGIIVIVAVKR